MRLIAIILVATVVIAAIMLPQLFFIVDENKVAIVTRFGQIKSEIQSPGLNIKTPFVDQVTYYEKRLLIFDAPPDSLLTKDKKRLIIDVYARGSITSPRTFRERLGDEQRAVDRAVDILASELRREIASHNQSEIITTKRDAMMANVQNAVSPKLKEFGITVTDVRIKRADFPSEIADSVYARMQAERKRKADKERAEGAEVDAQVRANADRNATIILANAQRDSDIIRGCGEAEATRVFAAALEQDPEFYTFQRSLEAYTKFLSQNTTVVMPVAGIGQLFEDIRKGVESATAMDEEEMKDENKETAVFAGAKCAEVSAAWLLAAELKVDQPELIFLSVAPKSWPDRNLGCIERSTVGADTVPGFVVQFSYDGKEYTVRTNQYGSSVAIC